ncbi:kinase-like protein [Auricularia subglabra TFB-10046 SS5]|nr:kinase-like protein [Auricularia subglabra TFB-10046 SS5]
MSWSLKPMVVAQDVLDCVSLSDLREWANQHPEEDHTVLLRRVAVLLQFLHSVNFVHGDLHATNIHLRGEMLSFVDMKYCGIEPVPAWPSGMTRRLYAPPGHLPSMAPELVRDELRTAKTDVYAFGMLIFELYAGHSAFSEVRPKDHLRVSAMARLCNSERPGRETIDRADFTDGLWELMTDCWAQDPSARPTMEEIYARLA